MREYDRLLKKISTETVIIDGCVRSFKIGLSEFMHIF